MICHSLVNFSIQDDELKSAEIHPGEFASFCQLKPGRYRYKVVRRDPKAGGVDTGKRRIDGVIVVGTPPRLDPPSAPLASRAKRFLRCSVANAWHVGRGCGGIA